MHDINPYKFVTFCIFFGFYQYMYSCRIKNGNDIIVISEKTRYKIISIGCINVSSYVSYKINQLNSQL